MRHPGTHETIRPRRTTSRTHVIAALAALVLGAGTVWAQNFGAPPDSYLRLEWEVEQANGDGPRITGYVHNDRGLWALNVRLLVEAVDPAGRTVSMTRGYVSGDIPPRGRAYFQVPAPAASGSYRVRVESFDWLKGGPSS